MANPVGLWNLRQRFESAWDYYGMTKNKENNDEENDKMNITPEEIEKIRNGEFVPRKVDSIEDMWNEIKY